MTHTQDKKQGDPGLLFIRRHRCMIYYMNSFATFTEYILFVFMIKAWDSV